MPEREGSVMTRLSKLGFIDTERTTMPVRRRIRSGGVPPALANREVFVTDDPPEASRLVGQLLGSNHLKVDGTEPAFQASMNAIRLRDVSMAYLDFRCPTTLEFAETGDHYTVHMLKNGTADCVYDGKAVTALTYIALVVNPRTRLTMHLGLDSPQLIIRIETQALRAQLSRMLGRSVDREVVFEPLLDLTTDPTVRWHSAIQLLSAETMTPASLIQRGIGGGPIEELVISSLLWVQQSSYFEDLMALSRPGGRPAVRRSISFIEQNLASPIAIDDLATFTRMSVRSIQQAFRDDLGTTPMAYIRDRRLERARAELADALPSDGVTVTEIAERWGFGHLGNFSAVYRRRFGELPSETLRR